MAHTRYTFCRTCEATCGLEVDVEDNSVTAIRPDHRHVVSKGYSCVKGIHFDQVQHSPDRVTAPQKRVGDRGQPVSWDQGIDQTGPRTRDPPQKKTLGGFWQRSGVGATMRGTLPIGCHSSS